VFAWRALQTRSDAARRQPQPGAYLAVPALAARRIHAMFTTRHGGFSVAPFSSMNLSFVSGDDPDVVMENRARALDAIGARLDGWTSGRQVHGVRAAVVTPDEQGRGARSAESTLEGIDALWTEQPQIALAILTADCAPILLADPSVPKIAVVHAGWRGLTGGVVESAVSSMGSDPSTLVAAIGPAIGPCCYEVGPEVVDIARATLGPSAVRRNGSLRLDLWRGARIALRRAGVGQIHAAALCTRCEPHRFFSHRGGDRARQGLIAMIRPA
jgi:purine-nucleoside/S-methyl-5'-thioadenosine phosphorylase / adenosine deaminase